MTRAFLCETGGAEPLDHRLEERRGDREVVRGPSRVAERALERLERLGVVVVARHVLQQWSRTRSGRRLIAAPEWRRLSRDALPKRAMLSGDAATPITGTVSIPRLTIAYSAGKICLYARSPGHAKEHQRIGRRGRPFM